MEMPPVTPVRSRICQVCFGFNHDQRNYPLANITPRSQQGASSSQMDWNKIKVLELIGQTQIIISKILQYRIHYTHLLSCTKINGGKKSIVVT